MRGGMRLTNNCSVRAGGKMSDLTKIRQKGDSMYRQVSVVTASGGVWGCDREFIEGAFAYETSGGPRKLSVALNVQLAVSGIDGDDALGS